MSWVEKLGCSQKIKSWSWLKATFGCFYLFSFFFYLWSKLGSCTRLKSTPTGLKNVCCLARAWVSVATLVLRNALVSLSIYTKLGMSLFITLPVQRPSTEALHNNNRFPPWICPNSSPKPPLNKNHILFLFIPWPTSGNLLHKAAARRRICCASLPLEVLRCHILGFYLFQKYVFAWETDWKAVSHRHMSYEGNSQGKWEHPDIAASRLNIEQQLLRPIIAQALQSGCFLAATEELNSQSSSSTHIMTTPPASFDTLAMIDAQKKKKDTSEWNWVCYRDIRPSTWQKHEGCSLKTGYLLETTL